jgi:hypothetical protein
MISVMPDNLRSYAVALFCITQRVSEDALFACGSMVRIDHFVCSFSAQRGKTAHNEHVKYRSAEGSARQLR